MVQSVPRSRIKGVELKCPHVGCGKVWTYKGTMKVYAICPDCRGTVAIQRDKA